MKEVEQVGFISGNTLEMMGGELCVNAKLAFAFQLKENRKCKGNVGIEIKLDYDKIENIILFNGIGFIITNDKLSKGCLKRLANKYSLPAFGLINYNKNKIEPYVYVKSVDSFVKETACGSGSIAFSIFSGKESIMQPTGKSIRVNIKNGKVLVNAEVEEVENENR